MYACVVHGEKDLRVEDRTDPSLRNDGVLVRIAYGGICGSDLHYFLQGRNGDYVVREPLVLGHEVVGTIAAVGSAVAGVNVGTNVAIHPATPCPPAGTAQSARLNRYPGGSYFGSASTWPHTQGGFATLVQVRADQIRPLPDSLPLRRAALAEPLAVGLHAVTQAGELAGKTVLVSGAGPIGALAIVALKHRGAGHVIATDLEMRALGVALAVGADSAIQIGHDAAPEPASVDIVIEASGAVSALASAIETVKSGGTIVQLGMLPGGPIAVPLGGLIAREITLKGTQRFDIELDEAIRVLDATPACDAVISHEFALEHAVDAFECAADSRVSSKVLISISTAEWPSTF